MNRIKRESASFRDPSGFVFYDDENVYRTLSESYRDDYEFFVSSGLKEVLTQSDLLVPFVETDNKWNFDNIYKVLKPLKIDPLSYPYEWCFSQLRDAALTTLAIQKTALGYGMTLKDASAFNIQFIGHRAVLIDVTSFEIYVPGRPWQAYKQFCQHFLCPLFLMAYRTPDFGHLQKHFIDGIPVDFTSGMLPLRTWFKFSALSHIHWHAGSQKQYQNTKRDIKSLSISKEKQILLVDNMISAIKSLHLKNHKTAWSHYYCETNYNDAAMLSKKQLVQAFTEKLILRKVVDFGANEGLFSRVFSQKKIITISPDIDPYAVEQNYRQACAEKDNYILPLVVDICNPSPALGWNNTERKPLLSRLNSDMALALALIHHLYIAHNLSFNQIASFFSACCRYLIIEFVPLTDSQTQRLVRTRRDNFGDYNETYFESSFQKHFILRRKEKVTDTERVLYLFEKKENADNE